MQLGGVIIGRLKNISARNAVSYYVVQNNTLGYNTKMILTYFDYSTNPSA